MNDEGDSGAPALLEETRAARGRLVEQLISVVVVTVLFGAALNIGSSLLIERLNGPTDFLLMLGFAATGTLLLAIFVPRISTSVKEFHEELEIALPLLVSTQDVEVARVSGYEEVTELAHAALQRRPAEERRALAEALRAGPRDLAARAVVTRFTVEMAQLVFAAQFLRASRGLLGPTAWYGRQRIIARMQEGVDSVDAIGPRRDEGGDAKPLNRFLSARAQGLPEKALLPRGMRLDLPDPTPPKPHRRSRARITEEDGATVEDVAILRAWGGRDSELTVHAYAEFSEYGLPSAGQPARGFMARCFLRNLSDSSLRALTIAEEEAAQRASAPSHTSDDLQRHTDACQRLLDRATRPQILRVFARMDGVFHVRLLSNERRQRGRYAWGAAVSRALTHSDVSAFLEILRERGQAVPSQRG
jgi:hypothetical protein